MLALIESGFFSFGEPDRFRPIARQPALPRSRTWSAPTSTTTCAAEARAAELYRDPLDWSRRALLNIAGASRFSSDETIRQYAAEIWGLQPVAVDLGDLGETGP